MRYNVITRQENSGPDASYFLRKIKAENISYLPEKVLTFQSRNKFRRFFKNIKFELIGRDV